MGSGHRRLAEAADASGDVQHTELWLPTGALQTVLFNSPHRCPDSANGLARTRTLNRAVGRVLDFATAVVKSRVTPGPVAAPRELSAGVAERFLAPGFKGACGTRELIIIADRLARL
jgi:hypothetical protein